MRRVRILRSVEKLLKALHKTIDSDKIIQTSKFSTIENKNDSSEYDVFKDFANSDGTQTKFKGPLV